LSRSSADDAQSVAEARCNEIFALAAATAALGIKIADLQAKNHDRWLRMLDILSRSECETIEPVIIDVNSSIDRDVEDYNIQILERDYQTIDSLITIFEFMEMSVNKN
jgi:hypothetical protein